MKLDALDPELVLLMTSIGNAKANTKVFEHSLPPDFLGRPGPAADRGVREAFLKAKYVEKRWIPEMEDWEATLLGLMRRKHQFKPTTLLSVLVQPGADINWKRGGATSGATGRSGSASLSKPTDLNLGKGDLPKLDTSFNQGGKNTAASASASSSNQRTILHKCVMAQNFVCAILLLKRECQVDPTDGTGMSPLHIAAQINAAPMVRLLLQHGASLTLLDAARRTPRDEAVAHDSLDCVWLLSSESDDLGDLISPHRDGPVTGGGRSRMSDPSLNLSGLSSNEINVSSASSPPNTARGALAPPSPPDMISALAATERHSAGDIGFVSPQRMAQSSTGLARSSTSVPSTGILSSTQNQSFHAGSSSNSAAVRRKPSPSNASASVSSTTSDYVDASSSGGFSGIGGFGGASGGPQTPAKRPSREASDVAGTSSPHRFQSLSLRASPQGKELGFAPPPAKGFYDDADYHQRLTLSARKAPESKHSITSAQASNAPGMVVSTTTTDEKRTNMRRSKSAKSVPSNVVKAPLPAPLPEPIPLEFGDAVTNTATSGSGSARGDSNATAFVLPPTPKDALKESKRR